MKNILFGAVLMGIGLVLPHAAVAATVDRTLHALESLAAKGSARAQYELAMHYDKAQGAPRDSRLALSLYCKAARQGHAEAARRAGHLILTGGAGFTDKPLGYAWLRQASSSGARAPDRCEPLSIRPFIPAQPPARLKALVDKLAPSYGLDPALVLAVMSVESGFNAKAVSEKNAMGLMQLIPETAERFGVREVFKPEDNIRGGMRYLRWLLAYFEGDVTLALAGYNAGEGAVVRYKGAPPYRETQDYLVRVRSLYAAQHHSFDARIAAPSGISGTQTMVAELSYAAPQAALKKVSRKKTGRKKPVVTIATKTPSSSQRVSMSD